jgi:hypothetical protein
MLECLSMSVTSFLVKYLRQGRWSHIRTSTRCGFSLAYVRVEVNTVVTNSLAYYGTELTYGRKTVCSTGPLIYNISTDVSYEFL